MALTAKRVTKLTAPGRYHDGHRLYLRVVSPTNRHWLLRYELFGRERWLGLGSARDTDLRKARERALRRASLRLLNCLGWIQRVPSRLIPSALLPRKPANAQHRQRRAFRANTDHVRCSPKADKRRARSDCPLCA